MMRKRQSFLSECPPLAERRAGFRPLV